MEKIKKTFYKYCVVPKCQNTIRSTPDKVFFPIPKDAKIRKQWCKAIGIGEVSSQSYLHCCEDHFDIEQDTLEQYKVIQQQGQKATLRVTDGVLPHKFECQKRNMIPPLGAKRKKISIANEGLSESGVKTCYVLEESLERENLSFPSCSQEKSNNLQTLEHEPHLEGETFIREMQSENSNSASENCLDDIKSEPLEEQYEILEDGNDINLDDVKIEVEENPIASKLDENLPVFMPCTRQILPKINMFSIIEYFVQNDSFKNIDYKILKSDIDINAEDTIGFVQLHTMDDKVTVQGTVAFDRDIAHVCIIKYDNFTHTIYYTNCECQQSACQHILAFLMWLHRRSEEELDNNMSFCIEPLVQQTTFLKAKDIVYDSDTDSLSEDLDVPENIERIQQDIVHEFVKTCKKLKMYNSPLYRYLNGNELVELSLHRMMTSWRELAPCAPLAPTHFLRYCTEQMAERGPAIDELATLQDYGVRQELQYGRLEPQQVYEASLLTEQALPVDSEEKNKIIDAILNPDMSGIDDEVIERMRKTLEERLNIKINKCGIILCKEYPMLCAVPYGFSDTHVVDIVCIDNGNKVQDFMEAGKLKPHIQLKLQLNMLLAKKDKAYFFIGLKEIQSTVKRILIHEIKRNKNSSSIVLEQGIRFWTDNVFKILSMDQNT